MSDDRTESATPRKRSKARSEGQVAKSADLIAAVMLTTAFILLLTTGKHISSQLTDITVRILSNPDVSQITVDGIVPLLTSYFLKVTILLAPFISCLIIAGIAINYYQVGFQLSPKAITPNIVKLNPINGIKRIISIRGLVELVKGILKIAIIAYIGYSTIYPERGNLMALALSDIATSGHVIIGIIFSITWKVCLVLFILGIIDFVYQKYEFEKSIKMTKQEVKDEYKNVEGNPVIKQKIKSVQMQMAQSMMMKNLKTADVVVTNPTHFAVALKYDSKIAPAPIVVAKGADLLAKRLKMIAKEHNIAIIENKPLARSLYKLVKVNSMIPEELFVAVAEVLAYVYKKNKKKRKIFTKQ